MKTLLVAALLLGCEASTPKAQKLDVLEATPALIIDVSPFCTLLCQVDGQNVVRWEYTSFGDASKCPVSAPSKELLLRCLQRGKAARP